MTEAPSRVKYIYHHGKIKPLGAHPISASTTSSIRVLLLDKLMYFIKILVEDIKPSGWIPDS